MNDKVYASSYRSKSLVDWITDRSDVAIFINDVWRDSHLLLRRYANDMTINNISTPKITLTCDIWKDWSGMND